jgi:hypothetical protein
MAESKAVKKGTRVAAWTAHDRDRLAARLEASRANERKLT